MKQSANWREAIAKNRYAVIAVALIVIIALVYLVFFITQIAPAARARSDAAAQLTDARNQLAQVQNAQTETPDSLGRKLVEAQAALTQSLSIFLPDYQASQIVDQMYQEATASGVAIVEFQTQVMPTEGVKPLYTATTVNMTVQGTAYSLINYLAGIKETQVTGIIVNTIGITRADTLSNLQMNFSLFTSPYAAPPIPIGTPVSIPTATPIGPTLSPEAQLAQSLDSLWAAQNWPEVIRIIEQIRAINPNYDDVTNKLYAAHVNYGYQLQSAGNLEGARREFVNALAVNPDGGEAADALRALTTPAAPTTYVVQPGDTLVSIARRFGITLQQLMQANNLTSFGVLVGQQLIIPPP